MKTRIYLRIAKNNSKIKVAISTRPNYESLGNGYKGKYYKAYPTLLIALDINIDDKEFLSTNKLLDLKITSIKSAIEIKDGVITNEI
jgi:hypothetical protein